MINNNSALAAAFWENSRLDDCPIYDFHAHMGQMSSIYFPSAAPEAMVETMKRCGTKMTIFCSHVALSYADAECVNLEAAQRFPEYMKAYHAVIPYKTDYNVTVERMEKYAVNYFGFKFHNDWHSTALTDKTYAPFLAYMNENKLASLLHTWGHSQYDGVEIVTAVAEKYPDAIFICGHAFHDDWKNSVKIAAKYPNIMFELTAVLDNYGAIEILCEYAGSERILFGTDLPWFDTHHGIGAVLSADMTDGDRRNIFYRNGEKLLKAHEQRVARLSK